jgi:hypothetical protein
MDMSRRKQKQFAHESQTYSTDLHFIARNVQLSDAPRHAMGKLTALSLISFLSPPSLAASRSFSVFPIQSLSAHRRGTALNGENASPYVTRFSELFFLLFLVDAISQI